jgi:hypothetical protein
MFLNGNYYEQDYFWVTIFNLGYPQIQMASENEMEGQNIFLVKTLSISHTQKNSNHGVLLLLSNGRSWIYSISLLASQYSFGNSLEVWSSFGHTRR